MSAEDTLFLAALPGWAFGFALLIARIGCACMLFPGVGEAELPGQIRAGFAIAVCALLLPVVAPLMPAMPASLWRLAGMVAAELVTGLWLGWLVRVLMLALPIAGQIVAGMAGLANVLQPDPAMGAQTSALSRALGLAAPVLFLAAGLHAMPLAALAGSYRLIPPGSPLPAADTAAQVTGAVAEAFGLALRLAGPFVLAGMVWQLSLGLLARLVPQLQVYFAALPGQIIGGIAMLALLVGTMLGLWLQAMQAGVLALPGL